MPNAPFWDYDAMPPTTNVDLTQTRLFVWVVDTGGQSFMAFRRRAVGSTEWEYIQASWTGVGNAWQFNNGWGVETSPLYLGYSTSSRTIIFRIAAGHYHPGGYDAYEYQVSYHQTGEPHNPSPFSDSLILTPTQPNYNIVPVETNTGLIFFEGSHTDDDQPDYIGWDKQEDDMTLANVLVVPGTNQMLPSLGYINTIGIGYFYWLRRVAFATPSYLYDRIMRTQFNSATTHQVVDPGSQHYACINIHEHNDGETYLYGLWQTDGLAGIARYDLPNLTNEWTVKFWNNSNNAFTYNDMVLYDADISGETNTVAFVSSTHTNGANNIEVVNLDDLNSTLQIDLILTQRAVNLYTADDHLYWKLKTSNRTILRRAPIVNGMVTVPSQDVVGIGPAHAYNTGAPNAEFRFLVTDDYVYMSRGTGPNIYRYNLSGGSVRVYDTGDINVQDMLSYRPPGWSYGDAEVDNASVALSTRKLFYTSSDGEFHQNVGGNSPRVGLPAGTLPERYFEGKGYTTSQHAYFPDGNNVVRVPFTNMSSHTTIYHSIYGTIHCVKRSATRYSGDRAFYIYAIEQSGSLFRLISLDPTNYGNRTVIASRYLHTQVYKIKLAVVNGFAFILYRQTHNADSHVFYVDLTTPNNLWQNLFQVRNFIEDIGADEHQGGIAPLQSHVYFIEKRRSVNTATAWYLKVFDGNSAPSYYANHTAAAVLYERDNNDDQWEDFQEANQLTTSLTQVFVSGGLPSESNISSIWEIPQSGQDTSLPLVNHNDVLTNNVTGIFLAEPLDFVDQGNSVERTAPSWVTTAGNHRIDEPLNLEWSFNAPFTSNVSYKLIRFQQTGTQRVYEFYNGVNWETNGEPLEIPWTNQVITLAPFWDVNDVTKHYQVSIKGTYWSFYSDDLTIHSLADFDESEPFEDGTTTFLVRARAEPTSHSIRITVTTSNTDVFAVDIQRTVNPASMANLQGLSQDEIDAVEDVTIRHDVVNGVGAWNDRRCRSGVDYQYRARLYTRRTTSENVVEEGRTGWSTWTEEDTGP